MNKINILRKALFNLNLKKESSEIESIDPCSGELIYFNSDGELHSSDFDDDFLEDNEEKILSSAEGLFVGSGIRMMFADEFYCMYVNNSGESIGTLVYHQSNSDDSSEDEDEDFYYPTLWFSIVVSPKCGGRGISKKMVDSFIEEHSDCVIKSETWNRNLDNFLERIGFQLEEIVERTNGEVIKNYVLYPRSHYKHKKK
jgi:RimJ/RimL family protein N-acetyltransferase